MKLEVQGGPRHTRDSQVEDGFSVNLIVDGDQRHQAQNQRSQRGVVEGEPALAKA
jgi:hypothetical protein